MKNKIFKIVPWILLVVMAASFAGCKAEPETVTSTTTKTTTTLPAQTVTSTATLPGETVTQTQTGTTITETTTVTEAPTTTTTTPPETRTITDMYGRQLTVPYEVNRVLCAGPVEMELVFMLAPEKLAEGLHKLDRAARRSCYLTWRAIRSEGFEAELFNIMHKTYHPHPEYPVILNILYKLGIPANLDIFSSISEGKYPGLEEAVSNLARGEEIDDDTRKNLAALVERNFSHQNGSYFRTSATPWALIYWHKSEK